MKKEVYEAPVLEIIEVDATVDTLNESYANLTTNSTAVADIEDFKFGN